MNRVKVLQVITRLMLAGRYDIVPTNSSKASIPGPLAARLARVPIIVHTALGWISFC